MERVPNLRSRKDMDSYDRFRWRDYALWPMQSPGSAPLIANCRLTHDIVDRGLNLTFLTSNCNGFIPKL